MAAYAHDDKLLIHFFQDSLSGAAVNWYAQLERSRIRTWKDLADAFLKQYKHNLEMAPDRSQLQSMFKRENETFKEYALRWRELAAQVQPPLSEKEIVTMFIDTLQAPYYEKMIGSVSASFSDIVLIGERIKNGLRSGRLVHDATGGGSVKRPLFNPKRKEGEADHVAFESRRSAANFVAPSRQPYYPSPYQSPV